MKTPPFMILFLCLIVLIGDATAESRDWTDKEGNTIKAEFIRREVESVVLRKEDDTEVRVPYSLLSEEDQKFVMLRTPPRIEINVEPSVDTYKVGYLGNDGYDYTVEYEVVEPSVLLRRTSTEPYDAELKLELVILGRIREIDRYLIIDRSSTMFSFSGKTSYEFLYHGYPLDLQQIRGSWRSGIEYEGYLAAVRDTRDVLIAVKASKGDLERNAEALIAAEVGSMLTDHLQVIQPRRIMPDPVFEQPQLTF